MRITKSLSITMIVLLVIVALIAIFVPFKCSAQTAGEFTMTFQYSAGVDKAMKRQHGEDWIPVIRERLREAWKNHRSTAVEAYKASMSEMFSDDINPEDLRNVEAKKLQEIADSVAARKARRLQREADSLAAIQTQGAILVPQQEQRISGDAVPMAANVGKALSPRMLFTEDLATPGTTGGGGGNPLGHAPGGYSAKPFVYAALAITVAVAVVGFAGYGIYVAITGKT